MESVDNTVSANEFINSQKYTDVTKLANFYGKWPGNYLRDLGYTPDIEIQKQLLSKVLNTTDLDSALLAFGWVKQVPHPIEDFTPIKRTGRKKVEKTVVENLPWDAPDDLWVKN